MSLPSPRAAFTLAHSVRKAHFKGWWGPELQPASHIVWETSLAPGKAPGPSLYGGELPSWQRGAARGDRSCIASAADADVCDRRGGCQETASSSSGAAQPTRLCTGDVMLLWRLSLPASPVSPHQRWRGKCKTLYRRSRGLPQSALRSLPSYRHSGKRFAETSFSSRDLPIVGRQPRLPICKIHHGPPRLDFAHVRTVHSKT